jgi:hypothetical protein
MPSHHFRYFSFLFFSFFVFQTGQSQEMKFGSVSKEELSNMVFPNDSSAEAVVLF